MRCYLVQFEDHRRYAGTSAEAREIRLKFAVEFDTNKKNIIIEQTEIPTSKTELLQFVNDLCKLAEAANPVNMLNVIHKIAGSDDE